jgi:hypothetical protein
MSAAAPDFDPLVPRPIDRPSAVPLDPDADLSVLDDAKILAAPDDPVDWPAWRAAITRWAEQARSRIGYSGERYSDPAAAWTQTAWSVALVWLWDEQLYDHAEHRFTVAAFLEHARSRFGGFDAVVLWHAYPVIGIDPRNQYDYYREVPDLAALVGEFQRAGVRVFLDYNPWDTGTRRPAGTDPEECAALLADTGADGLFLDTLKQGDPGLLDALDGLGRPVALEGESRLPLQRIADHQLSWAQWFADSAVPGVLRAHLFERRHMMHHTRRWNRDHSEELQSAWLNGCGILVWECVFGSWVGWNDRDASVLRRMLTVFRAFPDLLLRGEWTPLADLGADVPAEVYASRFSDAGTDLWLLVNRGPEPVEFRFREPGPGRRVVCLDTGGSAVRIAGRGIAAVVEHPEDRPPAPVAGLVRALAADPIASDSSFPYRPVRRIPVTAAAGDAAESAVCVPPGDYTVTQTYRRRETGWYGTVPYVEEWKPLPPRLHDMRSDTRTVTVSGVAVDAAEVTRGQFHGFVAATGYRPASVHRFRAGDPPEPGTADDPVTGVDLADARAYASWRGARLPTEFEWQLAAADPRFSRRSPLVWNWTESEHTDGRTRFAILKGGSEFRAAGSDWYTDGGPQPPCFALQIPLLGEGLARSECIGFRCAVDLPAGTTDPKGRMGDEHAGR